MAINQRRSSFSNPAVNRVMNFDDSFGAAQSCTYGGIFAKVGYFLLIMLAGVAAFFYMHSYFGNQGYTVQSIIAEDFVIYSNEVSIMMGAWVITLIAGLVAAFVPKTIPVTGTIYCAGMGYAVAITSYIYDKNDEMYEFFPVDFKISYTFTLSKDGLRQDIYLTNNSDKALPVSICTHTCINSPLKDGGNEADLRLCVPVGEKCELDSRCLPTERLLPPTDWDKEYKAGKKTPTGQKLDNDMYTAVMNTYKDKPFNGVIVRDIKNGVTLLNEVSEEFKFWNIWNHDGDKGYFCPEPMTAMINAPNLSLDKEISGYCEIMKGETFKCWQRFYTE